MYLIIVRFYDLPATPFQLAMLTLTLHPTS